jgi:hypothetical protein
MYTNVPGVQPVPVLNAGFATEVEPTVALIKHSKFKGYPGLPDNVLRLTSFVAPLIVTTFVGLGKSAANMLPHIW